MFSFETQPEPANRPSEHLIDGEKVRFKTEAEVRDELAGLVGKDIELTFREHWRGNRGTKQTYRVTVIDVFDRYAIVRVTTRRHTRLETIPFSDFLTASASYQTAS